MSKRFTETTKWQDPWFRKLKPENKAIWEYLRDSVDAAGFWKKDYELASFLIGLEIEESHILKSFNDGKERVKDHGTHLELTDFIFFQYGVLSEACKAHKHVMDLVEKYRNKGFGYPIHRVQDKDIDKDKEIRGIVKGGRFSPPSLEELKAAFSEKGFTVSEAEKFMAYFESVGWVVGGSRKPMKNWRGAVSTWCGKLKDSGVKTVKDREKKPDPNHEACGGTGKLPDGKKCWCLK